MRGTWGWKGGRGSAELQIGDNWLKESPAIIKALNCRGHRDVPVTFYEFNQEQKTGLCFDSFYRPRTKQLMVNVLNPVDSLLSFW